MALHHQLPIYRTGRDLLALSVKVQEQMPRSVKRSLGDKIGDECMKMLISMAQANASKNAQRAAHIETLMTHLHTATVLLRVGHDERYIATPIWAQSVLLLDSIGKQGGGWLKSVYSNKAPAA